jgi:hypothetical protein
MQAALLTMLLRVHGAAAGSLLDGQHGAWYADIVSRLGYVPSTARALPARRSNRCWAITARCAAFLRRPSCRCWVHAEDADFSFGSMPTAIGARCPTA